MQVAARGFLHLLMGPGYKLLVESPYRLALPRALSHSSPLVAAWGFQGLSIYTNSRLSASLLLLAPRSHIGSSRASCSLRLARALGSPNSQKGDVLDVLDVLNMLNAK